MTVAIRPARAAVTCLFGLAALAAPPAVTAQGTAVPPASAFFGNNAFGGAVFSPDGHFLAVRTSKPGRRDFLAVIDLDSKHATDVAEYDNADIDGFQWVNDRRLVYTVHDATESNVDQAVGPGLFGVDRDGRNRIKLAARDFKENAPEPWNTYLLGQPGSQDSDSIWVQRMYYAKGYKFLGMGLRHLNTVTGKGEDGPEPDVYVGAYLLDAHGEPRLALRRSAATAMLLYRDPATGGWRELTHFETLKGSRDGVEPLAFGPDGTLYVAAHAGEDLATLRTFDIAHDKVGTEPLVATPGYDFDGKLLANDRLLGVRLTTDARSDVWFDPGMQTLKAKVDQAMPGTNNLITVPSRPGSPWLLVSTYSDVQPPRHLLYDTRTGSFEPIGASYPDIDPTRMGRQRAIRYKARDGLEIPGLLTLPPGGARKNLPMVVLVHGGPWVRGTTWGWRPESQFLATRGYAVLEVEFRGGTGLGARHFEAGMKQWGRAMQDDVADGTRWAIAEGVADPHRICIAGGSYGGYATLMGLVNDPDLYQCGIDWAGITDFELMYNGTWYAKSDASDSTLHYDMPTLIGDLEKDADQLKATSPLQQAARIRQPVLLAYGSQDDRVPLFHGKQFYAALKQTNRRVEWVTYEDEGHGWSLPQNRIDFWQRVERFLNRYIGQPGARPVTQAH